MRVASNIIKSAKAHYSKKPVFITPPSFKNLIDDEVEEEIYSGPSIEEIEKEITDKKNSAGEELRQLRKEAEEEAKRIIELAEVGAFQRIKDGNEKYKAELENARRQSEDIIKDARSRAEEIIKEAEARKNDIQQAAHKEGFDKGFEEAYEKGHEELDRIKGRLEKILGETINKRNEIIESSEKQLINISIAVAKKVVKAITESDQAVILRNVTEALRKVKGRAQVTIRVNINDLELTTRHKDDFYRMLDNIENVNVLEDPNIEQGGCIIETDFGDIDARIATQMNEIETAIKNIQPIKGF
ncbi:MAG TPA: flagellar assembly protein FliH [Spirochaetia bacterium]|nr:flagellar assembly protein FliH [Spirochaetia bacterium]